MQHRHLHAELAHEMHVVFDHDDRMLAGDGLEQLRGVVGLGIGHAGDRFVDQQQLRILRKQHADLEPLLLAMRKPRREHVALWRRAG